MTPDEFLTRFHQQRADLIAMRAALEDLAACLPRELRVGWLSTLRARTLRLVIAADDAKGDDALSLQAAANALSRLHRTLEGAAFPDPDEPID